MAKLIYIESSPRKKRSSSISIAKLFLEHYQKNHPRDEVLQIDLWKKELPAFDGDVIDAKYALMHGTSHTAAQEKAWQPVVELIQEFKSGDKYVISLPMWNFSIPYTLKHYIDLLVQPGLTFTVTPEGEYKGLVTHKKALLVYSRGGAYGPKTAEEQLDLQKRYMETILGFIGLTELTSIVIEPTLGTPEQKEATLKQATALAEQTAKTF